MKTFLAIMFRVPAVFTILALLVAMIAASGEKQEAAARMQPQVKLNKFLIHLEGNRDGRYGENFTANGTYIGDAQKVVLVAE